MNGGGVRNDNDKEIQSNRKEYSTSKEREGRGDYEMAVVTEL